MSAKNPLIPPISAKAAKSGKLHFAVRRKSCIFSPGHSTLLLQQILYVGHFKYYTEENLHKISIAAPEWEFLHSCTRSYQNGADKAAPTPPPILMRSKTSLCTISLSSGPRRNLFQILHLFLQSCTSFPHFPPPCTTTTNSPPRDFVFSTSPAAPPPPPS